MCLFCSVLFYSYGLLRHLHSFPTRRSSDLPRARIDSERYRSLQLPAAQSSLRAHNVDHGGVVCAAQAWLAARHTADSLTLELLRLSKEHHDGLQSRLDLSE